MILVKVITCGWEEGRSSVNASIETFQCIHFCVWIFEVYERIALKKKDVKQTLQDLMTNYLQRHEEEEGVEDFSQISDLEGELGGSIIREYRRKIRFQYMCGKFWTCQLMNTYSFLVLVCNLHTLDMELELILNMNIKWSLIYIFYPQRHLYSRFYGKQLCNII